ncbi:hypothetical protein C5167_031535 [Papaver somniferum]|uniref:Uncharacterized protein n=1 Tax=Papaver somniferum TaxID=3469 RepID=A0A4Y7K4K1_PAPSO|nr:hypothetical protein C5167_031535 [Papaver somniferum]
MTFFVVCEPETQHMDALLDIIYEVLAKFIIIEIRISSFFCVILNLVDTMNEYLLENLLYTVVGGIRPSVEGAVVNSLLMAVKGIMFPAVLHITQISTSRACTLEVRIQDEDQYYRPDFTTRTSIDQSVQVQVNAGNNFNLELVLYNADTDILDGDPLGRLKAF